MSTINKILELIKEKGKTQKDLCNHLDLSKQTFTEWKSGRSNSYMKYIPQIAEYLDVSVDYLLGKEKPQTDNRSGLSENTILICRGGKTKVLHFTPEQLATIEKMLDAIEPEDNDEL